VFAQASCITDTVLYIFLLLPKSREHYLTLLIKKQIRESNLHVEAGKKFFIIHVRNVCTAKSDELCHL
jgi:hypothetical protein